MANVGLIELAFFTLALSLYSHFFSSFPLSLLKVSALAEGLKDEKVHVGCGVQSSSFVRSKKLTAVTQGENSQHCANSQHFKQTNLLHIPSQTSTPLMLVVLCATTCHHRWQQHWLVDTSKLNTECVHTVFRR